jgi:hypothetical protein
MTGLCVVLTGLCVVLKTVDLDPKPERYESTNQMAVMHRICTGKREPINAQRYSKMLQQMIDTLMDLDPGKRSVVAFNKISGTVWSK